MALSSYRMHRIYLAATMNYGLGSDDPEELTYYNKLREEIDEMKKASVKKGIPFRWDTPEKMDKWIWILFLSIDWTLMIIGLPLFMILKGKKRVANKKDKKIFI